MNFRGKSHLIAVSLFTFMLWQDGKYVNVPMSKIRGSWVTQGCETKASCEALSALGKKPQNSVAKQPGLRGHPANDLCMSLGASVRILLDDKHNQWNFCLFSDGSMIDSWALLRGSEMKARK